MVCEEWSFDVTSMGGFSKCQPPPLNKNYYLGIKMWVTLIHNTKSRSGEGTHPPLKNATDLLSMN